tara:strand:+ start:382 stop:1257 length:876 start_codon:yes stop_codon:yes gene_type:complete
MNFIKEISEARMTRDKQNQRVLTYNDCCERLYLSLLALEMMRNYPTASNVVQSYCKRSIDTTYKLFKVSGTDLHNFIYFVRGEDEALNKLKDPGAAKRMQSRAKLPLQNIKSYLQSVSNGVVPTGTQQMFIRIENGLDITNTDYKGIRRALGNINNLQRPQDHKIVATKLLYALRAKLRNSDLIDDYSTLIAIKDLEKDNVRDSEPTISKPDMMPSTDPSYIYYRLLAKPQNMILIKAFLEHIRDGKPIPSNMVKAYAPVAKVMDDIVRAGPSYINMLKSIQNRAKKTLNR